MAAPIVVGILLSVFVVLRSGESYISPSWMNSRGFKHTGNWSSSVWATDATWTAWKSLASRSDFSFLPFIKKKNPEDRLNMQPIQPPTLLAVSHHFPHCRRTPISILIFGVKARNGEVRRRILEKLNSNKLVKNEPLGNVTIKKEGITVRIMKI